MRIDYDTISATYDGMRGVNPDTAGTILKGAGLYSGARVLDVGCGTGNIEAALAGTVELDAIGVDLSLGMLAKAKAKVPGVKWVRADSRDLPLRSESFDRVLMVYMLHHLPDFVPAIREAHRVLDRGRLVIVTASHKQIDESFISRFFPSYAEIDKTRFPRTGAITAAMREAGFSDVTEQAISVARTRPDEAYLNKVRSKHVSTFHLMSDEEFRLGLEKMSLHIRESAVADDSALDFDHMGTLITGTKTEMRAGGAS